MAATAGAIRAGKGFVELFADDSRLVRGLRAAQAKLKAFGASVTKVGTKLLGAGALLVAPLALATNVFADFDDKMRIAGAVSGATGAEFSALNDEAKRLGRTTSFTAAQVADAMAELGRAGFNPQQILEATEDVLALSRATATELPRATEIAGAALRGFGLDTSEMGRVADTLSATANKSAQTLEDLFEALKPLAPLAAATGTSIEDTAAAIGILANNGIKGSLAGNALARAYKNLSAESGQSALKKLGVDAVDSAGDLRPLADILADLGDATSEMGSAAKLAAFEQLFGRGQVAALKLAESDKDFRALADAIRASGGAAAETAAAMDAGIGGAIRRLLSALEGIAIAAGEAVAPALSKVGDVLAHVAGKVTAFLERNGGLVVALGAAGIALIAAGGIFIALGAAISGVAAVLGTVAGALAFLASPLGIVTAALAGGVAAWFAYSDSGRQALQSLSDIFHETLGGIQDALASGDIALAGEIAMAGLEAAWIAGTKSLREIWIGFRTFLVDTWNVAIAALQKGWLHFRDWWLESIEHTSEMPLVTRFAALIEGADPEETAKALREDNRRRRAARAGELQRNLTAIDDELNALVEANGQLAQQDRDRLAAIERETRAKLDELRARAAAGANAAAQAAVPDDGAGGEGGAGGGGGVRSPLLAAMVGGNGAATGTFNPWAIPQGPGERLKEIAANTKRAAEEAARTREDNRKFYNRMGVWPTPLVVE